MGEIEKAVKRFDTCAGRCRACHLIGPGSRRERPAPKPSRPSGDRLCSDDAMSTDYKYKLADCDVTDRRALESYRAKRATWLSWINADEHHAIWDVLSGMVWTDVSFRALTQFAIDAENSALHNTLLTEALIGGHVATQVLAIRRLVDNRGDDVISRAAWRRKADVGHRLAEKLAHPRPCRWSRRWRRSSFPPRIFRAPHFF